MVVEGEPVQDGVLLLINRRHGALAVDLVDVYLLLSFQHRAPPDQWGLTEGQLEVKHSRLHQRPFV